jgi:hypothetical protein
MPSLERCQRCPETVDRRRWQNVRSHPVARFQNGRASPPLPPRLTTLSVGPSRKEVYSGRSDLHARGFAAIIERYRNAAKPLFLRAAGWRQSLMSNGACAALPEGTKVSDVVRDGGGPCDDLSRHPSDVDCRRVLLNHRGLNDVYAPMKDVTNDSCNRHKLQRVIQPRSGKRWRGVRGYA